ncbi:hypothetical protein [Lutimonas sp.]|uniref:hypothetical protein n=1 Tax=Lutimonas sp. TaxID=1872403 RepID=UPI003C74329E
MVYAKGQEVVEQTIESKAKTIIIEFDLIDHIQLFNSGDGSSITVRAEGSGQSPSFQLEETGEHVLLRDNEQLVSAGSLGDDKVCMVEPHYTSYQIYVPKNRVLHISFMEGNFYTDNFEGDLNLKVEDGIIKLKDMNFPVKLSLNAGSIFLQDIRNTKIDAETNLGILVNHIFEEDSVIQSKKLLQIIGNPYNSIVIRTILANIYLYGSKG